MDLQGSLHASGCHLPSTSVMASAVPDLLRFLSKDAKVPLALAMGKVLELQKALLTKYAMTWAS